MKLIHLKLNSWLKNPDIICDLIVQCFFTSDQNLFTINKITTVPSNYKQTAHAHITIALSYTK